MSANENPIRRIVNLLQGTQKKVEEEGEKMEEMFDRVMFDGKPWPNSLRYQHQNVAPGGVAAEEEAALRATWGYPQPFSEGMS